MKDRELYRQKVQAHLDGWRADVDKMRARALNASADRQLELNRQIALLESKIEDGQSKLSELSKASEDRWESAKDNFASAWESLKASFAEVSARVKH